MPNDYKHYGKYVDLSPQIGSPDAGTLVIHTTKGSKKDRWSARIKKPNQPGYLVKSVKTSDEKIATSNAMALYEEVRVDAAMGVNLAAGSFDDVFEKYLDSVASTKSDKRIQMIQGHHRRYYSPYFGKKKIARITSDDIKSWVDWRITYWSKGPGKDDLVQYAKRLKNGTKVNRRTGKRFTRYGNVAKTPSVKTMQMEAGALMAIFRWAYQEKYISRPLQIDLGTRLDGLRNKAKYAGKAESRRGYWDGRAYNKLIKYLKRWSDGNGSIPGVYDDTNHDVNQIFSRKTLYDQIQFNCHVGLRPGELRAAKWKHVKKHRDGHYYLVVNPVDEGRFGKTGQRYAVIGGGGRMQGIEVLERRKGYSKHTKPDDYIFAQQDGSLTADQGKTLKGVLDRLDILYDSDGNLCTLYSARHTYATQRIKWGRKDENLDLGLLAKQMGTSEFYISRHYGHDEVIDTASIIIGGRKANDPKLVSVVRSDLE